MTTNIKIDGESLYAKLHQPKFHFLLFSNTESDRQTLKAEIGDRYTDLVEFKSMALSSQVAEKFGSNSSFCILLRPDNYIAFISTKISSSELTKYLAELLNP